jgi:hypothetical protein
MPDKLIPIREYPQSEPAYADGDALGHLGISAHVKRLQWPNGHYAVLVTEDDVERAAALLSDLSPHLTEPVASRDQALTCPYCSSSDVLSQPPYPLIALVVGLGAVSALLSVNYVALALAAGVTTVIVASLAFARVARWRCGACGRRYGSGASG